MNTEIFNGWTEDDQRFLAGAEELHLAVTFKREPITERARVEGIQQRWVYHSPDGFEWGYGGSGPSDLALNVLGLFVPPPEAWRLHHDFEFDVIAQIPRDAQDFVLSDQLVRGWIRGRWSKDEVKA